VEPSGSQWRPAEGTQVTRNKKTAVHGTPITPTHKLRELAGRSFCVSYADPRQARECALAVDWDGILMLDNGAFTAWRQGDKAPGGVSFGLDCDRRRRGRRYQTWAREIMRWCPQARAVVPDVIGGTIEENLDLLADFSLPMARSYMVWHLNEPLELLEDYADRFPLIAFGSCLEFDIQGARAAFADRVTDAIEVARHGRELREIHMMRGLSVLADFDFDSADSTNIARNHARCGGDVLGMADRIEAALEVAA
jgi:hypothetical protein